MSEMQTMPRETVDNPIKCEHDIQKKIENLDHMLAPFVADLGVMAWPTVQVFLWMLRAGYTGLYLSHADIKAKMGLSHDAASYLFKALALKGYIYIEVAQEDGVAVSFSREGYNAACKMLRHAPNKT